MNAIEIRNLNKKYRGFSLKDVSIDVPTGTIVGLIGENGAGKTTLLNIILGITRADSGNVKVLGIDNNSKGFTGVKEKIGAVLDELGLLGEYNMDNIDKLMGYAYKNWNSNYFKDLLEIFEINTVKKINELSTGMKKKLGIVLSMAHQPDLLILDEPTANLDPISREDILDYILEYTRDKKRTVLISYHIVSDLEKFCDYICYLHKGQIILFEEKDILLNNYVLLRINEETYKKIPKEAIIYEEFNNYGHEVLAKTNLIPISLERQFTTLEDILVGLIRSGNYESAIL